MAVAQVGDKLRLAQDVVIDDAVEFLEHQRIDVAVKDGVLQAP
jgi:hypothetical protein